MTGRPSTFTAEVGDEICARLASGMPLSRICKDEGMPAIKTVYGWLRLHEGFRQQYARAREDQADTLADETIDIANTPLEGEIVTERTGVDKDGKPVEDTTTVTKDMIEHRRLQVETRKWFAARMAPRKYSERLMQEHSGPNGGPIETVTEIRRTVVRPGQNTGHSDGGSVPSADGAGQA